MEKTFTTFKTMPDLDQAKEMKRFLSKNNIRSFLNDNHSTEKCEFEIKVMASDYNSASQLVKESTEKMIEKVTSDYCLYSFSQKQLYDVLLNEDVWSDFDYLLAKKILNEKGLPTDSDSISRLREEKKKDTAKPESSQILHIMGGYILALMGGVAGIVIGFLMWNSQRQMPNGITVFSYSEVERRHGRIIFGLGILIFVIVLSIRLRQIPF
ncbi:hypothetical protein FUA48_09060 [Flavobacterium alkalisoli]|uniref:Uncharacterized protein n=1 Tax=Flavobacterium alkalisoli TaxID=2602769 RepID=A0A5B9FYB2_9FLAO|nr:hypothetical protein [Flavobacterium alkalisoli]QEE49727.1 hypothetical protein FUA48_09060 [Flavobacterium alkalisoli]